MVTLLASVQRAEALLRATLSRRTEERVSSSDLLTYVLRIPIGQLIYCPSGLHNSLHN